MDKEKFIKRVILLGVTASVFYAATRVTTKYLERVLPFWNWYNLE